MKAGLENWVPEQECGTTLWSWISVSNDTNDNSTLKLSPKVLCADQPIMFYYAPYSYNTYLIIANMCWQVGNTVLMAGIGFSHV